MASTERSLRSPTIAYLNKTLAKQGNLLEDYYGVTTSSLATRSP